MKKRAIIQTIMDGSGNRYHIPPRKSHAHDKNLIIRLVIPGRIPSKKNRQIATINYMRIIRLFGSFFGRPFDRSMAKQLLAEIKPYIRPADDYLKWEEEIKADIIKQCARWQQSYSAHGLTFPITRCRISVYHYWKDRYTRDNSNKAEGIHDMLVSAGIITQDAYENMYKNTSEAECYKGEVIDNLTIITITAHSW